MTPSRKIALCWAAWTALAAAVASAQPVQTQFGRQLDSNFQLGSGGYNSSFRDTERFDSQLYVNGQVTGLSGFGVKAPYFSPEDLRLDLPSAQLSTFRRQSVGLAQVLGGSPYQPSPYYDRTSTVFGLGGITGGLTAPGTSIPHSSTPSAALVDRLHPELVAGVEPPAQPQPGRRTAVQPPALTANVPADSFAYTGRAFRPGAAAPFGLVSMEDLRSLAGEFLVLARPVQEENKTKEQEPGAAETYTRETSRIELALPSGKALPEPGQPEAVRRSEQPEQAPQVVQLQQGQEFEQAHPGQDVYTDLLRDLRRRTESQNRQLQETFAPPEQTEEQTQAAPSGKTSMAPTIEQAGETARTGDVVIVRGLAGASPDAFNKRMAAGADKLRAGRFYAALGDYRFAATISPGNPLARVGMGLARFGAGEPFSAALELRRALAMLPDLDGVRLDIEAMMSKDLASERLDELEAYLAEKENPDASLLLLLAFVHQNLGQAEQAREAATKLKAAAGDDQVMRAYAEHLLTGPGRRPRPVETQPAEK